MHTSWCLLCRAEDYNGSKALTGSLGYVLLLSRMRYLTLTSRLSVSCTYTGWYSLWPAQSSCPCMPNRHYSLGYQKHSRTSHCTRNDTDVCCLSRRSPKHLCSTRWEGHRMGSSVGGATARAESSHMENGKPSRCAHGSGDWACVRVQWRPVPWVVPLRFQVENDAASQVPPQWP